MARSVIYVADQDPSFLTTVKDGSGNVINLTGYLSVQFALRQAYDTVNKFKATATIVTPLAGLIRYDLASGDLAALTPGIYVGQWILTDPSNRPQHVYAGEFELRKAF